MGDRHDSNNRDVARRHPARKRELRRGHDHHRRTRCRRADIMVRFSKIGQRFSRFTTIPEFEAAKQRDPAAGVRVMNAPPIRLRGVSLLGTKVRLQAGRICCGDNIGVIHPGSEHAGEIRCETCGRRRAWLTHETAAWLQKVRSIFGAPQIITIRPRTSFPQEREEPPLQPQR
jgi:hypothetical protein